MRLLSPLPPTCVGTAGRLVVKPGRQLRAHPTTKHVTLKTKPAVGSRHPHAAGNTNSHGRHTLSLVAEPAHNATARATAVRTPSTKPSHAHKATTATKPQAAGRQHHVGTSPKPAHEHMTKPQAGSVPHHMARANTTQAAGAAHRGLLSLHSHNAKVSHPHKAERRGLLSLHSHNAKVSHPHKAERRGLLAVEETTTQAPLTVAPTQTQQQPATVSAHQHAQKDSKHMPAAGTKHGHTQKPAKVHGDARTKPAGHPAATKAPHHKATSGHGKQVKPTMGALANKQ